MRGDIRRRGALTHADTTTDRAATFEYALLFEDLQISVPVTQIVARRIVMREENVIGHRCHLLRAIQTMRPPLAGSLIECSKPRILLHAISGPYCDAVTTRVTCHPIALHGIDITQIQLDAVAGERKGDRTSDLGGGTVTSAFFPRNTFIASRYDDRDPDYRYDQAR